MVTTLCDSQKPDELLDFWFYTIGANIVPVVSRQKTAKKDIQWEKWQKEPIPEELFVKWKNTGAFNDGIGIILGKLWRGSKYDGMYLIGVDLDNQIAIEEFCTRDGENTISLEKLAQWTIVKQHKDDTTKAHVYFLSDRPYAKKSSNAGNKKIFDPRTMPAIEVKGDGEHGLFFCLPSIHRDGCRYEIIGTNVPAIVDEEDYELHIDNICRKYGLTYLDDNTVESKVAALVGANHRNKAGERHNNTLAAINHYIYKNAYKLLEEQQTQQHLEDIILKYNREQNEPAL
jgi:hypothetical protein